MERETLRQSNRPTIFLPKAGANDGSTGALVSLDVIATDATIVDNHRRSAVDYSRMGL
jgi:hypothetical protein